MPRRGSFSLSPTRRRLGLGSGSFAGGTYSVACFLASCSALTDEVVRVNRSNSGIRARKQLQISGALQRRRQPFRKVPDLRELLSSSELASETPFNGIPNLSNVPETLDPELEGSDEEEEHPEAQAQALRDYQLSRDRFRRAHKEPTRYGYSYIPTLIPYDDPMGLNRR
ncbi:hypothetical protein M9H77_07782 [Catharanthus roseus]|uniref:Uncharacterized protein n=1 Tax=Catharanthus roseus TaxID=4058 RepID=A0ACC0BW58_CATRO|nr:hypothetical protein M9H77_07782 [Catharanthus roseus]